MQKQQSKIALEGKPVQKRRNGVKPNADAKPKAPAKRKRAEAKKLPQLDRLERLSASIAEVHAGTRVSRRTSRLLMNGVPRLAQKVIEEAGEVAIEAVRLDRSALINESVDLLYNLSVLWFGSGVAIKEIWAEMDRREATLGISEKLPKIFVEGESD
jgi:phosphoribosyl-ATP pyrophosphohydrolase